MKKMAKKLVAMLMAAMLAVACVGAALAEDTYSVETENFETWDYSFCNINAFGDDPGVGMLNIQSWGNKKLALGDDGTCDGVGCTWKITLSVDGTEYTLKTIATIVGVATFYAQFSLNPKGKNQISVCLGTACYVKGSGDIYEKLKDELGIDGGECTPDAKFSLDACRCVGACGLAPVVTINDDVYGRLTGSTKEIEEILAKYAD